MVIICQSVPEKCITNPGFGAVKCLICGGIPVPMDYWLTNVVLEARPGRKGCKQYIGPKKD